MEDAGHRSCVEAALNFETGERVPINNFALATAAHSAGYSVEAARWDPGISSRVSVDYSLKTLSDFVKPILDSQVPFLDLGMKVDFPENDYGRVPKSIIKMAGDIEELELFDPYDPKTCPNYTRVFTESIRKTAEILPEDLHICGLSWGPITTAGYLMGVENMLMATFTDPDLVKSLTKKASGLVSSMQRCMIDSGSTVMWMADPTSSEDIIPPDMFSEYSKPYIREVVRDVRAMDKTVPAFIHICGNTLDTMEQFPEIGADCLSYDHAVNTEKALRKSRGKFTLMGNIDPVNQIMMGTPESVMSESRKLLETADGRGGFILAPGCETPITSPDENVLAMGKAVREWSRKS
ncbi:MAG: uroporphyrinogen decarboxylase family protein [Candidatus Methanomethylophilaceae archaeon]|nr:uroporphyrinogen decarboxylase family protein [Candidatus Methanomethylophilaceae archaeon]